MNQTSEQVTIVEVGPRDGLQNEPKALSTPIKIELIHRLMDAGVKRIEASSFVSPKAVPALSDAEAVIGGIQKKPDTILSALTPNLPGFQRAVNTQVDELAVFTSASEAFNQANIRCSVAESFSRIERVVDAAKSQGFPVRGYISCVISCPFEGPISPEKVAVVAARLADIGCYEISLGDTLGTGTPSNITSLVDACTSQLPISQLAGHFHNTFGQAIANIYAAWKSGMRTFDSAVAGLGGCPYAPGAGGNVSTEDVLYLFQQEGIETGIDLQKMALIGDWVCEELMRSNASHAGPASRDPTQGRRN